MDLEEVIGITAFKGMNKNSNDAITYGAIFYKCSFTADEDVIRNANTAIGRPWGAYASVAVIECELSGHISTKGSSGASKNERYVTIGYQNDYINIYDKDFNLIKRFAN